MAFRLNTTFSSIKFHLRNIYEKMDCTNQVQVVVKAMRLGMISIDLERSAA